MKIRPVGSEFSGRTDGRTETTNITLAFRNLKNAPKTTLYKSVEITNKMQPCNRIYYSNVY